jgi:hypothetical protein
MAKSSVSNERIFRRRYPQQTPFFVGFLEFEAGGCCLEESPMTFENEVKYPECDSQRV